MEATDKRTSILRAALELFAENGFHGAPTSLLAEKAGVGVGTIYRYFKDKDQLIRELFREVHDGAKAKIFTEAPAGTPIPERYVRMMSRLLRFFLENPAEFRFLEQYFFSPYYGEDSCETPEDYETLQQLLLKGQDEQIIKDAPMEVLQALTFGPLSSLARQSIYRNLKVDEEMIRQVVQASWDGLKR